MRELIQKILDAHAGEALSRCLVEKYLGGIKCDDKDQSFEDSVFSCLRDMSDRKNKDRSVIYLGRGQGFRSHMYTSAKA